MIIIIIIIIIITMVTTMTTMTTITMITMIIMMIIMIMTTTMITMIIIVMILHKYMYSLEQRHKSRAKMSQNKHDCSHPSARSPISSNVRLNIAAYAATCTCHMQANTRTHAGMHVSCF